MKEDLAEPKFGKASPLVRKKGCVRMYTCMYLYI